MGLLKVKGTLFVANFVDKLSKTLHEELQRNACELFI